MRAVICTYNVYYDIMNRFIKLMFVSIALICQISCSDDSNGDRPFDVDFVVPESVTISPEDNTLTFRVRFGKSPEESDIIVLESEGKTFECTIVDVSEKNFTFKLYEGVRAGNHKVSIKRGSKVKAMGETNIIIDFGTIEVTPEEGVTVYGSVTCNGKGLKDVVISDGVEVVKTDAQGIYQMKSAKKYGYVFISIPSGYEVINKGILPQISANLVKAPSKVERVDFQVYEAGDQSNHTLLVMGDMHMANRTNDKAQFSTFVKDVNDYVSAHQNDKVYAVTLGDMTWDLYWYSNSYCFDQYLADANKINNLMIFHTIGNHDHDMNADGDFNTILKYKDAIAPDYYSFNIGKVHYIVLDNIYCRNTGAGDRQYTCMITPETYSWLEKDLSHVSKSTPIVVTMHSTFGSMTDGAILKGKFSGFDQVHFLTGHSHRVANSTSSNWFEHNCGAVCATWWWSGKFNPGIHIGTDGSEGGYAIFNITGTDFKWQYKPTNHEIDCQVRSYDRNEIQITAEKYIPSALDANKTKFEEYAKAWTSESTANEVYINVWNYDPDWKIEVTENGKTLSATKVSVEDPLHLIAYTAPAINSSKSAVNPTFATSANSHTWKVTASSATSTLDIKVTDRFGNVYTEKMQRPKAFSVDAYK